MMNQPNSTFSTTIKTSGKLHEMLVDPDLTPQKLFSIPNITGDIIQNIQNFFSYCRRRRDFTLRIIKICFDSGYEIFESHPNYKQNSQFQGDTQAMKKVAQGAIEVLTSDQDALVSFLFAKAQQQVVQTIIQQQISGIQSQAQRLFSDNTPKKEPAPWQSDPIIFQPYQLIKQTLSHLSPLVQQKNETCLGYINKLYSSLLRREGNLFLQFLSQNKQYIPILVSNVRYFSIGNIIALMLACEDKSGEYRYENLKKQIFERLLAWAWNYMDNQLKKSEGKNNKQGEWDGFIVMIEEILNCTKQAYYEYFQDFKRCANILVNEETLNKFYQYLALSSSTFSPQSSRIFTSCSIYLQLILKRINSQFQQNQHENSYYRQSQEKSQPTMKFEIQFLYEKFEQLLLIIAKTRQFNSLGRVAYLSFLINLVKSMQNLQKNKQKQKIKDNQTESVTKSNEQKLLKVLPNQEMFQKIIRLYSQQKNSGLSKNYLFQLLKTVAKKLSQQQTKRIAEWILSTKVEQKEVQKIFQSFSDSTHNKNQSSCYILSILFQIQSKYSAFLSTFSEQSSINLQPIHQKYKTKLANYGQEEEICSPIFQDLELVNFRLAATRGKNDFLGAGEDTQDKIKQVTKQKQKISETQVVGKNSVVIPVLNLPHKNQTKVTIEQQHVEPFKFPSQISRQALIRDLKNTRIQLPQKFKQKKVQQQKIQESSKGQQKLSPKQQKFQFSIKLPQKSPKNSPKVEKQQVIPQVASLGAESGAHSPSSGSCVLKDKSVKISLAPSKKQQQKYFIRHILLF